MSEEFKKRLEKRRAPKKREDDDIESLFFGLGLGVVTGVLKHSYETQLLSQLLGKTHYEKFCVAGSRCPQHGDSPKNTARTIQFSKVELDFLITLVEESVPFIVEGKSGHDIVKALYDKLILSQEMAKEEDSERG